MGAHRRSLLVRSALLALLILLALAMQAKAAPILLFNTGVDAGGVPLAGGSLDPHWSIVAGPGIMNPVPAVVVTDQSPFNLYAQDPNSKWVWVFANGNAAINLPFTFEVTFDLTGFDPSTATISGAWGVDNMGFILLNGFSPIGMGTFLLGDSFIDNFHTFHPFSITGGFLPGINTLDFVATDTGNPGGLNVNQLVGSAAPVPEPSTLLLLGSGLAGLGGIAWRRHRRK